MEPLQLRELYVVQTPTLGTQAFSGQLIVLQVIAS